jgi:hypothetical protein
VFTSVDRVLLEDALCEISSVYASAHSAFTKWRLAPELSGAERVKRARVESWHWWGEEELSDAQFDHAGVLRLLPDRGRVFAKGVVVHGQRRDSSVYEDKRSRQSNTSYSYVSLKRLPGGAPLPKVCDDCGVRPCDCGGLYFGRIERMLTVVCPQALGCPEESQCVVYVDTHITAGRPNEFDPDVLFTMDEGLPSKRVVVPSQWLGPVCWTLFSPASPCRYYGLVRPVL